MSSVLMITLAMATASTAAAPALSVPGEVSARVSVADLDLTTRAGVAELDRRIHRAAARICIANRPRTPIEMRAEARCRMEAIAGAAQQRERAIAAARAERMELAAR